MTRIPLYLLLLAAPQAETCEEYVAQMRAEGRTPGAPVPAPSPTPKEEPKVVVGADFVILKEELTLPDGRKIVGITPTVVQYAVPASGMQGEVTLTLKENGKTVRTLVRP